MTLIDNVLRTAKKKLKRFIFLKRLMNPNFCIISRDCWGSRVYQELNLEYNTPFVGLFLFSPCYIRLLSNFHWFMDQDIVFVDESKYPTANELRKTNYYPIGVLGGEVEVHFLHYKSVDDADEKWKKRSARVNYQNLFIAYNDKESFTEELLNKFENLPFQHKVFFTANKNFNTPSAVWISECAEKPYVDDLYKNSYLVHRHFDVIDWLNNGSGKLKPWVQFLNKLVEIT